MLRHSIYGIKFYSEYITCCFPAIVSNLFFLVFVKLFYLEMVYLRFSSKVDLCYIFNALFYGPFVTSIQGLLNNFPTQFSSINFRLFIFLLVFVSQPYSLASFPTDTSSLYLLLMTPQHPFRSNLRQHCSMQIYSWLQALALILLSGFRLHFLRPLWQT